MRLTGSGVYARPAPAPTMPPGLVQLMEGLTRDVLRHNPPDMFHFCANHMATLLQIRDGRAPYQILTLDQKITRAQQKIRDRAEQRRQEYDKELELQSRRKDVEQSLDSEIKAVEETTLENTFRAPIHHEKELTDALEVEIFHKPNDDKKNKAETSSKVNEDIHVQGKGDEELHMGAKRDDTIKELNRYDIGQEGSVLKEQIGNSSETIISEADDIFGNPKESISGHARIRRSIDHTEENIANSADNVNQITDVTKEEMKHVADSIESKIDIIIDDSENLVKTSEASGNNIVDATIERDDTFGDVLNEKLDDTADISKGKVEDIAESTVDKCDNYKGETTEKADKIEDLTMQQIRNSIEEAEVNMDNTIHVSASNISIPLDVTEEKISNIVAVTTENIGDVLNATEEKVDSIADVTIDEINTITEEIEQNIDNVINTRMGEINNIVDENEEIVKNKVDATERNVDSIVDASLEEVDYIVDANGEKITNSNNATKTYSDNFIEPAVYRMETIADSVKESKIIDITAIKDEAVQDSIEEKIENAIDVTVGKVDTIVDLIDKNKSATEQNVEDDIDTAEKIVNAFVESNKEKSDVQDITFQKTDNITVGKINVINNTLEKINHVIDVSDEKFNTANITEQEVKITVDTDVEKVENMDAADEGQIGNSDNLTGKDDENTVVNIDANENQVENIEHNTNEEIDGIVATTIVKDNISKFPEETIDNLVMSVEEKVNKINEAKLIEDNDVSKNAKDRYHNINAGENCDKTMDENDSIIAPRASETYLENYKKSQELPIGHIAQINGIDVSIETENITNDSALYIEANEEPCIKSNVIELTVVGNGNSDNDAANEITDKESVKTGSEGNAITEPVVSLNNEDLSDQPQTNLQEDHSDSVGNVSNISEPEQLEIDFTSFGKNSSMDDSTIGDSNDSILELDVIKNMDELPQNIHSPSTMDLETAAITIQKVFRTFLFKSRGSTFDDTGNDGVSLIDDNNEKEEAEFPITSANLTKERRALGISRMDTVLQTVNEEKSLSLSTDDSSTLSSAATIIQAHVRGFLVRNKFNFYKTNSSTSIVNSDEPQSLEVDTDQEKKNKTVLNIHIVPEGEHFLSRDESMITSMDLSLDGSPPSSTNLHPLGYNKNERRKQLKREDAVQSMSPPSNNSGKLSEEIDSVKDIIINDTLEQQVIASSVANEPHEETNIGSRDTSPTKSTTMDTVIEAQQYITEISSSPDVEKDNSAADKRKRLKKMSSDEADVVTPFVSNEDKDSLTDSDNTSKLLHSGEFHDVVLPTKVSRTNTAVVREFKNVLVYFLKWNS